MSTPLNPLTWRIQTLETGWNSWCRWWSFLLHLVKALWKWKRHKHKCGCQAALVINRTCEMSPSLWGIRVNVNVVAQNGNRGEIFTWVWCCIQQDTRRESHRSQCCLDTSQSWFLMEKTALLILSSCRAQSRESVTSIKALNPHMNMLLRFTLRI